MGWGKAACYASHESGVGCLDWIGGREGGVHGIRGAHSHYACMDVYACAVLTRQEKRKKLVVSKRFAASVRSNQRPLVQINAVGKKVT